MTKRQKRLYLINQKIESSLAGMLAISKYAASGFAGVDESIFEKRKSICLNCPFWDSSGFGGTGKCLHCGCSILKLKIKDSCCPIGKW